MKKEIEDYFASPEINLPVSEIIKRGLERERIKSKPCIQAAIEEYYNNRASLNIKRFKIAWWIWKRAKQIENSEDREKYTSKYESERAELKQLRLKKMKYEQIRRANFDNAILSFGPYWIMIALLGMIIYFLR